MTAELAVHRPAELQTWWPGTEPTQAPPASTYAVRRNPGLFVNAKNPVHMYYPQVVAEFGVRIVVATTATYRLELKP